MGLILLGLLGLGVSISLLIDDDDDPVIVADDPGDEDMGSATDGDDTLRASGNDLLLGLLGNDDLTGTDQAEVRGGGGDDIVVARDMATGFGEAGDDTLTARQNAQVYGGAGNDTLFSRETSWARGGEGNDTIQIGGRGSGFGGEGDDVLFAENESRVDGGLGDDRLVAFVQNALDTVSIGEQTDVTLTGGEGQDTFAISASSDPDGSPFGLNPETQQPSVTITDFKPDEDVLSVSQFSIDQVELVDNGNGDTEMLLTRDDGLGFKVLIVGIAPDDIPLDSLVVADV